MKIPLCIILFLLSGCATTGTKTEEVTKIVEVKVPVIQCPIPPIVPPPELYIHKLTKQDVGNWDKIAKYYIISMKQLIKHSSDLNSILQTYRESPTKSED